jgi:hypothetical protein
MPDIGGEGGAGEGAGGGTPPPQPSAEGARVRGVNPPAT